MIPIVTTCRTSPQLTTHSKITPPRLCNGQFPFHFIHSFPSGRYTMGTHVDAYPYNLGGFHRQISTTNPAAQKWFDRGLIWCYAFHHEESAHCFEKAIQEDPGCAMAYWGLAFALGPNYNKPWDFFDEKELKSTLEKINHANAHATRYAEEGSTTDVEKAIINAIQSRVPQGLDEIAFRACNEAYAEAMATVYKKFPRDLDVASLYADSMMNLSAWDLWNLRTGEPSPGARSLEAKAVLESALAAEGANTHLGILHLYIHLMEMSKTPEAAPSHLDILVGDYRRAIASNADACLADEKYLAAHGGNNFYTFYRMHDYHSLIYAAMFAGQYKVSIDTVARMEKSLPPSLLQVESPPMADWVENFASVRVHVLVRFGQWKELVAIEFPSDPDLYCVTTAMIHYGKGIAYAATGDMENATKHRDQLHVSVANIPSSRISGDFPNKANVVLQVATAMLDGELEYRKGNYEVAFDHLRTAIDRDDALTYAEPWPWMMPTRHAYAALLLERGRITEAAQAYAADLGFDDTLPRARQHPNNIWALHGYHECLLKLDRNGEAKMVQQQLRIAQAVADVDVKASCFCRMDCCGT
ncbi:TPR domain protein [Periconia macrospinosa]|uniref:TPR domain protein n=1 Tax=Periconia macrospinosa TaxID=97972 RepID=A0A2V1DZE8_9PLEO|nr:TPR domain protein [Periconia macrospinosa]